MTPFRFVAPVMPPEKVLPTVPIGVGVPPTVVVSFELFWQPLLINMNRATTAGRKK
jgi:hypothetical protein